MKKITAFAFCLLCTVLAVGQENAFNRLDFLIGDWGGNGSGFGNNKSKIESSFHYVMDGKYIEVVNDSKFEPTEKKPEGEHHIDKGFISYDSNRQLIVFRQFNIEGFVNQYVLNDSISNDSTLVFETEDIENLNGGKARWTIKKLSTTEFETIFEVKFPGREFMCFGTNNLTKK